MGDVIPFPSIVDEYVKFKTDEKEIDRFNIMLDKVIQAIEESYPEVEDMDPSDYVLIAEAITSAVMRENGIEHPLQNFADRNMGGFFEEYGL